MTMPPTGVTSGVINGSFFIGSGSNCANPWFCNDDNVSVSRSRDEVLIVIEYCVSYGVAVVYVGAEYV